MGKENIFEVNGIVTEALQGTQFKVELENGQTVIAYLSGKLRQHFIHIIPGDSVAVEISPYDLTKGRIVWRNV